MGLKPGLLCEDGDWKVDGLDRYGVGEGGVDLKGEGELGRRVGGYW